jgi:hypothetical protein
MKHDRPYEPEETEASTGAECDEQGWSEGIAPIASRHGQRLPDQHPAVCDQQHAYQGNGQASRKALSCSLVGFFSC